MPTLVASSEDVKVYELAILYAADLTPKEESQLLKRIDDILGDAAGKALFRDAWSRRGLAYPVKGATEAKAVILYIEVAPAKIREIDGAIRLEKGVLRHLILIPPKGYEAVSFEDRYKEWIQTRETASEMKKRESEERVKAKVEAKAKMEAKRMDAQKRKRKDEAAPAKPTNISAELEKLISDEDLNI